MEVKLINVTQPMIDREGNYTEDPSLRISAEDSIVAIARVSTNREDLLADNVKLLNYLIKNKHWSPFEHPFVTLKFVTSRAIGRELLRHRSFTFQEFSQRYAKAIAFEPIEIREQATTNKQSSIDGEFNPEFESGFTVSEEYEMELDVISDLYNKTLATGVAKECARFILPECTQTTIYMTGSLRSWIHMLELRLSPNAQKEVRLLAQQANEILAKLFPNIWKALEWYHRVFNDGIKSKQEYKDEWDIANNIYDSLITATIGVNAVTEEEDFDWLAEEICDLRTKWDDNFKPIED